MTTQIPRRLAGTLAAVALGATAALVPTTAPAQTALMGTGLHARMSSTIAYPHSHGGAWYESRHGWREFEIHLYGIQGLSGKTVTVRVHGAFVGRMRVHSGDAHLWRHRGLPTMAAGNRVRVNTKSGALVSTGTLHRSRHHVM